MELHRESGSPYTPTSRTQRAPERPNRLGRTLREAREDKDLELRDLAEITSVRLTHLEALEVGDYQGLPEEVYSKNFIKLYAQAVGLDPARMLLLYGHERRALTGISHAPGAALELPLEPPTPRFSPLRFVSGFDNPRLARALGLMLTLLLVVGVVLAALWAFNGLFATTQDVTRGATPGATVTTGADQPQAAASEPATAAPAEVPPAIPTETPTETPAAPTTSASETTPESSAAQAPADAMVLLSLRTTPSGAEVSIDGYPFGQSPITDAPVRAGERTVQIEWGGYRAFERTLDLSRNRRLNIELSPTRGAAAQSGTNATINTPANATTDTPAQTPEPAPGPQGAGVKLTVTAEAWLEVYAGSARGEGERLVYKTAQPGESFSFNAPVFIFSGNAGGVTVARGDAAEPLGASGAVVGAAYD